MKHLGFSSTRLLIVILALGSVLWPGVVWAQSDIAPPDEISLFVGSHLPSEIEGVTEVIPVVGARYGVGLRRTGHLEFGLSNSRAKGVDFANFDLGLRGSVTLDEGIEGIFGVGGDASYYIPVGETKRRIAGGFHAQAGLMVMATRSLWFRGDLKYMGGPGSSVFVLLGLAFQLGDSNTNR